LYFEGSSPSRRSLGRYAAGESLLYFYIPMFPWKDVLMGWIRKIQKTQGEKGQIRKVKKNKKERMEERKRRDFYRMWRFLYSCALHRSGSASGYHHCATLPQENPLVWEPPLQKNNNSNRCMEQSHLSGFCFFLSVLVCNLKHF
jgi:hypothetical protein